jgi:hypothetical protein
MNAHVAGICFMAADQPAGGSSEGSFGTDQPVLGGSPTRCYWEKSYCATVYFDDTVETDEYAPAYRYGTDCCNRHRASGGGFESLEAELRDGWDAARRTSILSGTAAGKLDWDRARHAVRDGWNAAQRLVAGKNPPGTGGGA